jgi:hypothetical protein
VNDPDFWTKLLPERKNKPDPKILNVPRQRKAIQRFSLEDVEDSDLELSDDEKGEEGGDNYEEEEVMGDDEYEPPSELMKESEQRVTFIGWSQVARNRMQKGILLFGYGRWRKIRSVEKIRRSELVMELYGRAYLRKLCGMLIIEMEEVLMHLDNKDPNELDEEKDCNLAAARAKAEEAAAGAGTGAGAGSVKTAGGEEVKVEEMKVEEMKVEETVNGEEATSEVKVEGMEVEEVKPSELNVQIPETRSEPLATAPSEAQKEEEGSKKEAEPEVDFVKLYDHVYDEDRALNDPAFLAKLKHTSKTIFKRLKLLAMLGDLVRSEFRGISEDNWPVAAGSGPGSSEYPDWWTPKHDRDLLIGTYKHGFGR